MSEYDIPTTAWGERPDITRAEIDQYGYFDLADQSLREQTEQDQRALEAELEALAPEILAGEVVLNNTVGDELEKVEHEIIQSLNEKFSFLGVRLSVTGVWHKLELAADPEGDGHKIMMVPNEVCETAVCRGFAAALIDGEWRIGPAFSVEPQDVEIKGSIGNIFVSDSKAIALPEESALIVSPQEDPVVAETHAERALAALENHNNYLMLHLEKSEFLRASHAKQQRFMDRLTTDAQNEVLLPNGGFMDVEVETSTVYVHDSTLPEGFRPIVRTKDDPCDIAGKLLGVGLLEQSRLDQRPLRSSADFIDRDAGLCLIIQPQDDNLTNEQIGGSHLYVPFNYCDILRLFPYIQAQ